MILYEAAVPGECIALHENKKDYSMQFLDINSTPYLMYYSNSDECTGIIIIIIVIIILLSLFSLLIIGSYAEYQISTSCTKYATDSDEQINYKWEVETY